MSDPRDAWLAEAVDAARECARDDSPASLEGAATRSRIHASLERRRGTSKRRLTLISAVLASMFGSTAFAYYNGWRPFSAAPDPARAPSVSTIEPEAPARRTHGRAGSAAEELPPPIEPVAPPIEPDAPPSVAPTVPSIAPNPTRRPTLPTRPARTIKPTEIAPPDLTPPAPEVVPAPPAPDVELAAYQQAHDAHFKGGSPAAALAAWDRYLAQFPGGKLAPEARYDRALVLVKLERWSEAREALRPFATAPVGSYRQREAAKILDAIRDR